MQFTVDGDAVNLSKALSYKGMMVSGVPNLALAIGYINASWIGLRRLRHLDR